MALKLYYGGFCDYKEFVVAENEEQAILKVGIKINAPFLPITVVEIPEVDGYQIQPIGGKVEIPVLETQIETEISEETTLRHCKKCDFTCETQGQLLAHYREKHPKGD